MALMDPAAMKTMKLTIFVINFNNENKNKQTKIC